MPALVALKNARFQIVDGMRGSPSQMRIAAALATANRCNKFVILHNKGMLFHTSPRPPATARMLSMPAILGACPALRRLASPGRFLSSAEKMAEKGPIPETFAA